MSVIGRQGDQRHTASSQSTLLAYKHVYTVRVPSLYLYFRVLHMQLFVVAHRQPNSALADLRPESHSMNTSIGSHCAGAESSGQTAYFDTKAVYTVHSENPLAPN